jgi:hypothetical protein
MNHLNMPMHESHDTLDIAPPQITITAMEDIFG